MNFMTRLEKYVPTPLGIGKMPAWADLHVQGGPPPKFIFTAPTLLKIATKAVYGQARGKSPSKSPSGNGKGFRPGDLNPCNLQIALVPEARLELAQGCPRGILSPLRLPVPPLRHVHPFYFPGQPLASAFAVHESVPRHWPHQWGPGCLGRFPYRPFSSNNPRR